MRERTKRILGIHLGLFLAELICVSAFILEISRALSGNTLSWAYVFEWPVFAVYALYMWRRLLREPDASDETEEVLPIAPDNASLRAYNAYLADVHRDRP